MKNEELSAKRILRQSIRMIKASYSREELEALSLSLLRVLEQHPCFVQARTVLFYHSLPDEVFTHAFIDRWCVEKEIVLPTVVGDDLELHLYTGPDCLSLGSYGILEPSGELFTDFDRITLAVIPGMAFDLQGNRLGRGKGYYDRLLPRLSHAYKLGLCFPFQILDEEIPHEPHDCRVDTVLRG
jgi:5-formyltetrahydrofolate cyclo-ligase